MWTIPLFFNGKICPQLEPNYQPISDQIIDGPSSYSPKIWLHQNPREIIAVFVDMNSDHFRVYLCIDL